jgi:GTP cyclohydrolase FolE2
MTSEMPDLHAERPRVEVGVGYVGHQGVKRPMIIGDPGTPVMVELDVAVGLMPTQRGAHMSRLIDSLAHASQPESLLAYVTGCAQRLRSATPDCASWSIAARATQLVTVPDGVKPVDEFCAFRQTNGADPVVGWGVALRVALACPQAQAVIARDADADDWGVHPSHNQVCDLRVELAGVPHDRWGLTVADLVSMAESAASGPVRERHKRRSEADTVRNIHRNARFAEDSLRDLAAVLRKRCPDATSVCCDIVNHESIFEYPLRCTVVS